MKISLGDSKGFGSLSYYTCEGCGAKAEVDINDGHSPFDHSDAIKDFGWMRREFIPSVHPWFCSLECAYNSDRAKYLEKLWIKKDFSFGSLINIFKGKTK